jgi:hypothetical protein
MGGGGGKDKKCITNYDGETSCNKITCKSMEDMG